MPRRTKFEVVLDTSYFTSEGLQHRSLLALAMNGWARWLREHLAFSFRELVSTHQVGVVVAGGDLEYVEPFHFLEADVIEADVGVKVYRGGAFLRLDLEVRGAGRLAARVIGTLRPVLIGGGPGLEALPGNLPAPVLERFAPDEIEAASVRLHVAEEIEDIEDGGQLMATSERPLTIHRHRVEAADQWSFVEFGTYGEIGRDSLIQDHGSEHSILADAMGRPLRSAKMQLVRPLFVFDTGTLTSRAFRMDGDLVFVHRVSSGLGAPRVNLLGVERLARSA